MFLLAANIDQWSSISWKNTWSVFNPHTMFCSAIWYTWLVTEKKPNKVLLEVVCVINWIDFYFVSPSCSCTKCGVAWWIALTEWELRFNLLFFKVILSECFCYIYVGLWYFLLMLIVLFVRACPSWWKHLPEENTVHDQWCTWLVCCKYGRIKNWVKCLIIVQISADLLQMVHEIFLSCQKDPIYYTKVIFLLTKSYW